jgi:hypothetical protein
MLVTKVLRGTLRIVQKQLLSVTKNISDVLLEFDAIYVSHIPSHQNVSLENDVADALCSWSMAHSQPIAHFSIPHIFEGDVNVPSIRNAALAISHHCKTLPSLLTTLKPHVPLNKDTTSSRLNSSECEHCSLSHPSSSCCVRSFVTSDFVSRQPCQACLSPLHPFASCPLMRYADWRPVLSKFTPKPALNTDEAEADRASEIFGSDFDSLRFPNNCSRKQFLDYFVTVFSALNATSSDDQASCSVKAIQAFRDNFYFQGQCIRRSRRKPLDRRDSGTNANAPPQNPEIDRARRALRAALLLPKARIADVSKALRTGERIPLSQDIIEKIRECYPQVDDDDAVTFEPKPIPFFTVDRDALGQVTMSRSPSSHPGFAGFSFDILQNYCRWTYLSEDPDTPGPRWDMLVKLVSKIMSGNAAALSDFLLDVVGAFFNKNADKIGAPFALRNLGIEESLMRISATLVFETVLPIALRDKFLTDFDLGAGRKTGAELFGRLAALFAKCGAPIAVFDIVKAFNNLRRRDIMAAVAAFNHPLLTAFVHFMFSRDSKVTFRCPLSGNSFVAWLTTGIHQGNPLSVFIF